MMRYSDRAVLNHDQWQLLVDVLDGNCDQRMVEEAQDVLTRTAPHLWLAGADLVDEACRMLRENEDGDAGQ